MLLSMQLLLANEIVGMTRSNHFHHLSKLLLQFDKTDVIVIRLVSNCNVNRCMLGLLKVPLLGCRLHKFNLAVQKGISDQPELEETISKDKYEKGLCSTRKADFASTSEKNYKKRFPFWHSWDFFRIQAEPSKVSYLILLLIPTLVKSCLVFTRGWWVWAPQAFPWGINYASEGGLQYIV